jgi:hypothetical protein
VPRAIGERRTTMREHVLPMGSSLALKAAGTPLGQVSVEDILETIPLFWTAIRNYTTRRGCVGLAIVQEHPARATRGG